jgi:hypothetical protein
MANNPNTNEDPSGDEWVAAHLNYLDKLIGVAKNGDFPKQDDIKTINGLKKYISEGLPDSDKIQVRIDELRTIVSMLTNMGPITERRVRLKAETEAITLYEALTIINAERAAKFREDDENKDLRLANLKKIFEERLNNSTEPDLTQMTSAKAVIDWVDKYYAGITDDGVFKYINLRLPNKIQLMTRKSFVESLEHLEITITPPEGGDSKKVPFSHFWLRYAFKRIYDQFVFDPRYEFDPAVTRHGDFNLWPGFAYKPKKGSCWRFLRFIRDIICAGNRDHFRWLLAWLAQIAQEPWHKPGTAVVLIAKKGAGKSFFGKKIIKQFGPEICFDTATRDDLFGNWSDHLAHSIFIQLNEAIWAGSHKEMSELNEFITGETTTVRTRFQSTKQSLSYMHFLLNANPGDGTKNWVIPATFDERRYSALYVSEAQMNKKVEYFDPIDVELENGGYEAFMYFLKHYPFQKYNLTKGLETQALMDQKARTSMADKGVKGWWIRYCTMGELPYVDVIDGNGHSVAPPVKRDESGDVVFSSPGVVSYDDEAELVGEYYHVGKKKLRQEYAKSIGKKLEEIDEVAFGLEFNSLFPELDQNGNIMMINSGRRIKTALGTGKTKKRPQMNIYKIPKLSVCRQLLDNVLNYYNDWENTENWQKKEYE